MKGSFVFLLAASLLGAQQKAAPKSTARPGPAWETVKVQVEKDWARQFPREKIIAIEKKGEPDFKHEYGGSETSTFGSASFDWDDWGASWTETKVTREKPKGFFYRQLVLVTAERANGSRARFTMAAVFKEGAKGWEFEELATRADLVEELGGGGEVPVAPPADAARKLFLEAAQKQCLPEYKIATVKLEGQPTLGRSGKRFWYTYKVILDGVTPAGEKVQCEVTDLSTLRWDAEKKTWAPDSSFGCSTRVCTVEK